jgi:hypothetical protein
MYHPRYLQNPSNAPFVTFTGISIGVGVAIGIGIVGWYARFIDTDTDSDPGAYKKAHLPTWAVWITIFIS